MEFFFACVFFVFDFGFVLFCWVFLAGWLGLFACLFGLIFFFFLNEKTVKET